MAGDERVTVRFPLAVAGLKRWAFGSVAEDVIRPTAVPVLVLHRPQEGKRARKTSPIALVALDGSPLIETALMPDADVLAALTTPQEGTLPDLG